MKSFYKQTIVEAWRLAMNERWLWPLAFFASLLGLQTTFQVFFDIVPRSQGSIIDLVALTNSDFLTANFVGWSNGFYQIPWSAISISDVPLLALIILLLCAVIALTVVVVSAEGGLIAAIGSKLQNKKIDFFSAFRQGLLRFWEVFLLIFASRLIYLLFLGIIITPLLMLAGQSNPSQFLLVATLIYIIMVPVLVILDIIIRYSIMYVILEKSSIQKALYQSWDLFKANWIISLETALLVMVIVFVLSFVVLQIMQWLGYVFIFFILSMPEGSIFAQITMFTGMVVAFLIVLYAFIIFSIFSVGIWTSVFQRLNREVHYSKIFRSVRHLPILHKKII